MLSVSPQELLSALIHFALSQLPQNVGGFHRAVGVDGGGIHSNFSCLRLQEVLSDAVRRSWHQTVNTNQHTKGHLTSVVVTFCWFKETG